MVFFFFFKQKTAYEMRISDWSSDVCSSDLAAVEVHDLAGIGRARTQLLHHRGIGALRHEADVLAVRLVGDDEAEARGLAAHRVLLHATERKAQEVELAARGGEEEVALIAARIDRTVQLCPRRTQLPLDRTGVVRGKSGEERVNL